jgi:hypothetical protein
MYLTVQLFFSQGRQIKLLFSHPALYLISAVLILAIGKSAPESIIEKYGTQVTSYLYTYHSRGEGVAYLLYVETLLYRAGCTD